MLCYKLAEFDYEQRRPLTCTLVTVGLANLIVRTVFVGQTLDFEASHGFVKSVAQISRRTSARRRVIDHIAQRVIPTSVVTQFCALSIHAGQTRSAVFVVFTLVGLIATGLGVRVAYFAAQARTLKRAGRVQTFCARVTRTLNAFVDILTAGGRTLVAVTASTDIGDIKTRRYNRSTTDDVRRNKIPALVADAYLTDVTVRVQCTSLSADPFHAHFSGQTVTRREAHLFTLIARTPFAFGTIHAAQAHDFAHVPHALLAQSTLGVIMAYGVGSHARLFRHGIWLKTFVAGTDDVVIDGVAF